jgi:hypothetical protein
MSNQESNNKSNSGVGVVMIIGGVILAIIWFVIPDSISTDTPAVPLILWKIANYFLWPGILLVIGGIGTLVSSGKETEKE